MSRRQMNGEADTEIEIKVEPLLHNCVEEDNEIDFSGFERNSSIQSPKNMESLPSWNSHSTACLINQYKKFHSMVGLSTRVRSRREMFEIISQEMQKKGYFFSPQKCENKWKVLERKYKNLVFRERLKKPGRIKDYGHWEHKRALDEIFNKAQRQICSEENDFTVSGSSVKAAQGTITETNCSVNGDQVGDSSMKSPANAGKCRESSAIFESFLIAMNKNFELAEANRERRHREKISLKQAELEIQRKMLKLKEQEIKSYSGQRKFIESSTSFQS